jgi:DNA-directed RNA polymerase specialized sigma24 family protein
MIVEKTPHQTLIVKRRLPVRSKPWRELVHHRFHEGFGIEDIAIQLHCTPYMVRSYVRDLRERGWLNAAR